MKPKFKIMYIFVKPSVRDKEKWLQKIRMVKEFFGPKLDLITHDIVFDDRDPKISEYRKGKFGIDMKFYDEYYTRRALMEGADLVLVTVPRGTWRGKIRGWRTLPNMGVMEMQVMANYNTPPSGKRWSMTDESWENVAIHELMHGFYRITGQPDETHKWWKFGKLEKARDRLKFNTKETKRFRIVVDLFKKIAKKLWAKRR